MNADKTRSADGPELLIRVHRRSSAAIYSLFSCPHEPEIQCEMCFYGGRIIMNCFLTSILLLASAIAASAQMSDFKGYKDPALFTRMPHYFLQIGRAHV